MITAHALTKKYGKKTAVQGLNFSVQSGKVTGFLGPNGAGKSTTLRMVAGLDAPTSGYATVGGWKFHDLRAPLSRIGFLLDPQSFHPGRTAYRHLQALAQTHRIPSKRVEEVLGLVGLSDVAGQRAGKYSMGMRQRLNIAAALLGDPDVVVLDEPINGLDPQGVLWCRNFMKSLASEGRTVLVSSHVMSEMAQTADNLIIIGQGRMLVDTSMKTFMQECGADQVSVSSPEIVVLRGILGEYDAEFSDVTETSMLVRGVSSELIGQKAAECGVSLTSLHDNAPSLEEAFMKMTNASVEYASEGSR